MGALFCSPYKVQKSVWKKTDFPNPKKIQQAKSAAKIIMIIFFDHKSLINQHDVPPKTTANDKYYVSVLKILE